MHEFELNMETFDLAEKLFKTSFNFTTNKNSTSSNELDKIDGSYQQLLADVWVGIVLTLMVLSCICCMCSCLLYHKFQQWRRTVLETRRATTMVVSSLDIINEEDDLPSYTVVSGLPSYEEALEIMKEASLSKQSDTRCQSVEESSRQATPVVNSIPSVRRIPLMNFIQSFSEEKT